MDALILFLAALWLCVCVVSFCVDMSTPISGYTAIIVGVNTLISAGVVIGVLFKSLAQVFGG